MYEGGGGKACKGGEEGYCIKKESRDTIKKEEERDNVTEEGHRDNADNVKEEEN